MDSRDRSTTWVDLGTTVARRYRHLEPEQRDHDLSGSRSPVAPAKPSDSHSAIQGLQEAAGNTAVADLVHQPLQRQKQPTLSAPSLTVDPDFERKLRALNLISNQLDPSKIAVAVPTGRLELTPPDWLKAPVIKSEGPLVTAGKGPAPRAASGSDLLEALSKVPAFKTAMKRLQARAMKQVERDWGKIPTGGKGAVIATSLTVAGMSLAGALGDGETRRFLLDQLNGRDVPVPGVKGLSLKFNTRGRNVGVMITFNLAPLIPTF